MSELEKKIIGVIHHYLKIRGNYPKYIAISYQFFEDFYKNTQNLFCLSNDGKEYTSSYQGIPIKFVHRINYMEAMPRRQRMNKKMKRNARFLSDYFPEYVRENSFFSPAVLKTISNT